MTDQPLDLAEIKNDITGRFAPPGSGGSLILDHLVACVAEIERLRAAFQRLIGHCEPFYGPARPPEPPELDRYELDPLAIAEAKGVVNWKTPASAG